MRALLILAVAIGFAGCNLDIAESHYADFAQAAGRSWLPEQVLPRSTRDITEENNLDLNTSTGDFRFAQTDGSGFLKQLASAPASAPPYANWQSIVAKHARAGRAVGYYTDRESHTVWAFFCSPRESQCYFEGWPRR